MQVSGNVMSAVGNFIVSFAPKRIDHATANILVSRLQGPAAF